MGEVHALPGLDRDGLIDRRALAENAVDLGRPGFLERYARPALLFVDEKGSTRPIGPGEKRPARPASSIQIVTLEGKGGSSASEKALHYLHRVAFLVKRPANPFPDMISLGRAATCDIVIELETLSKVHGYFLREPDRWLYSDYRSKNGTNVNGLRLEKGERRPLADGDRLQFGLELHALFLSPESLYEKVRRG